MGLFTWVNYKADCWNCGAVLDRFQSKDGPNDFTTVEPKEVRRFYTSCVCGAWNEYKVTSTYVVIERVERGS